MNPAAVALALAMLLCGVQGLLGQSIRLRGITTVQYVDVQPVQIDSVLIGETRGSGLLRRLEDGSVARCLSGQDFCLYSRSATSVFTVPMLQDVSVSAWGFGRGMRFFARLRGRASVSEERDIWPRSGDAFDALVAYLELDRSSFRVRGGRQWKVSGLGYYNFDGASVLLRPGAGVTVEAFGGWSLARGLSEPRTSGSLAAIEPFAPDDRAMIVGVGTTYRPLPGTSVAGLYQREVRGDRAGLYTERVALDGTLRRWGLALAGSVEADLASRDVNELKLVARFDVSPSLSTEAFVRRYKPFFELWTIWGAFSPVGFSEGGMRGWWRQRPDGAGVTISGHASRRTYEDTGLLSTFGPIRSDGWRAGAALATPLSPGWTADVRYDVDLGFGAAKSAGSVSVQRAMENGARFGASLQAFQRIFEFRVDQGTVVGLGLEGGTRLGERGFVSGSLATYRHAAGADSPGVNWSQLRGSLRWEWTVGPEPGLGARGGSS